jgi:NADP-dependent 3-hydroxy acid dehydrogenase YdfG
MHIDGKFGAITGASSGIGRTTAKLLAERGASVVLGARGEEALAAIVDEITASGGQAVHKVTDGRHRSHLEALVGLAVERGGRLDVIVNNAGIGPISRFDTLRVDDLDQLCKLDNRSHCEGGDWRTPLRMI